MTPDSRSTQPAVFRIPPFRTRLWQAFCTWKSRLLFWGLAVFALIQHVALLGGGVRQPILHPMLEATLDEVSYVERGENNQRQDLAIGEAIPQDTRMIRLGSLTGADEFRQAAALLELTSLDLATMRLAAAEIPRLRNAPKLESLWITRMPLTPDVSELKSLQTLGLNSMHFSDVPTGSNPLKQLKGLPQLRTLSLSNSGIQPQWLEALRDVPSLRWLRIENTPVGDEIVPLLIELRQLKELRIGGSRFTRGGWNALVRARPDLTFEPKKRLENGFARVEQARARFFQSIVMAFCFPAFGLGMLISIQLKTQFASPRARLMPGFAMPHLTIVALITFFILGPPVLVGWLKIGLSPVGPLSLGLLVAVMFAWQSWLMSNLLTLPLLIVWFSLMFGAQTEFIGGILGRWFLTPETTNLAITVLAGSVGATILLAHRVLSIHEENTEYGLAIPAGGFRALTSRAANREVEKLAGRIIAQSRFAPWALDRWFELVMRWLPATGIVRRVALYQIVHGYGALIALPIVCVGYVFLTGWIVHNEISQGIAVILQALFMSHFVMAGVGSIWLQHGKWHAAELLKPQSRNEFVNGLFCGVCGDLAYATFWILVAQLVACLQGSAAFGRTPTETAAIAVAVSVGYLLVSAGVLLFILSYQNFWVYLGTSTFVFMVLGGLCAAIIALDLDRTSYGIPAFLTLCLLTGLTLLKKARTRWLSLELA